MTPPFREYYDVGKNLGSAYSLLPPGSCLGATDLIHQVGLRDGKQDLFAAGWGYYPAGKQGFRRVLAVTPEGTIVGVGVSGIRRPEIARAHPEILSANTGWRLYAVSEGRGRPLQVYGILPGTNRVCLLPGTQNTPAPLPERVLPPLPSISNALAGYMELANRTAIATSNDANHPVHLGRDVNLVLEGWVISADGESAMDQVFAVYPGGRVAGVPVARSDVADHFKKGSLLMCGYRITIPAGTLPAGLQPIQLVGARGDRYYKLPPLLYVLSDQRP
jgi:hypothetical protein